MSPSNRGEEGRGVGLQFWLGVQHQSEADCSETLKQGAGSKEYGMVTRDVPQGEKMRWLHCMLI